MGSEDLCLADIDIYSANEDKSWTCFPTLPLQIDALRYDTASEQVKATITKAITGKDLVSSLGEPNAKAAELEVVPALQLGWSGISSSTGQTRMNLIQPLCRSN